MKNIIIFLSLLFFLNCNSKTDKKSYDNTQTIISLVIDEFAKPIPPPPPKGLNKKTLDSIRMSSEFIEILNKKLSVAIYPVMESVSNIKENDSIYSADFNFLVSKLNKLNTKTQINIENVKSKKGHQLFYVDTLKLNAKESYKRNVYYDEFDILLQFSRIKFNTSYTKAVLVVTYEYSSLNGGSVLCFLEKEKERWSIKYTKLLLIS